MAGTSEFAIDLRNVSKIYRRRVHALAGISMQVRRGEIFGLLGPNGAGKSTLVKIMMTVVRPTRADGSVLGNPVGHKPTLRHVGYLPENHRFPKYLTGRRTLDLFGALSKVDRATRRRRTDELLQTVGMTDWADRRISEYSKGMMQRIGLAQAMCADPDLIVLDEPTDGVDPGGRRDIRDVLLNLRERGKTIFINSHLLSELENVCDRVAILVQGSVARQGTIDELTVGKQCYVLEVGSDANPWQDIGKALPGAFDESVRTSRALAWRGSPPPLPAGGAPVLPYRQPGSAGHPETLPVNPIARGKLPSGTWCEFDGVTFRIGTTDARDVQSIIDAMRQAGLILRRLNVFRPSLEELFFEAITDPITGRRLAPGAAATPPPLPGGRR